MTSQNDSRSMRPSIRLQPGAELRAILDQWVREAKEKRSRLALKIIKGGCS
jgi:hypothetical protein